MDLQELASLVKQIGSSVTPLFVEASGELLISPFKVIVNSFRDTIRDLGIMEPVFASLLHPVPATRIAGAWCLRAVTYSVPGQLTPLIDRCLSRFEFFLSESFIHYWFAYTIIRPLGTDLLMTHLINLILH